MKTEKSQVALSKLIFTMNWEDPLSDIKTLNIKKGDVLMTISSGGCNTLEFLLHDPGKIYAVDINQAQNHLLNLKKVAIKHLNHDEFIQLMGIIAGNNNLDLYDRIIPYLDEACVDFWNTKKDLIKKGILMGGRYERFVLLAKKVIGFLQGKGRVRRLFEPKDLESQKEFFDSTFNTWRFRKMFDLLFNKRRLAKRGLSADYFHFDDGSKSFAESFYSRARKAMRDIPIVGNYFLHLYLRGAYRDLDEVPNYLKEENFETLKERVDRIECVTMDAKEWMISMPDNSLDGLSLSNICELKSEEDSNELFDQVLRISKNNGRCCFRNLMIPREVPEYLEDSIIKDEELSAQLIAEDRSFVYSKVAAYEIAK
ncbi:MAG: DUF3419 family protein [Saprospiraceae bacterium]|nr:DUF3419 family protein [Saprospiraceae bacterium]